MKLGRNIMRRGIGLTTECTRPRIAWPSSARRRACFVECAAGDAGRYASLLPRKVIYDDDPAYYLLLDPYSCFTRTFHSNASE